MKIAIITSNEPRKRFKYLFAPLFYSEHEVSLIKTTSFFSSVSKFSALNKKQKIDLVIFIGIGLKALPVFLLAKKMSVETVVRLGGNPIEDKIVRAKAARDNRAFFKYFFFFCELNCVRFVLSKTDIVYSVNKKILEDIECELPDKTKKYIVHQYSRVPKKGTKEDYKIGEMVKILSVSNLSYEAKVDGIIRILKELILYLKKYDVSIEYTIVGGGQHAAKIEKFLSSQKVPLRLSVKMTGYLSHFEDIYLSTDVFIYFSEFDALPNVLLEAMMYGIPIMTNNSVEFQDIFEGGKDGFLFSNSVEFQDQLGILLRDEMIRKTIGMNAIDKHQKRYSFLAVREKILKILAEDRLT